MSFSNITQNPPLGQMNIEPLDAWYAAIENLTAEGDASSVNIPWLLAISVSQGNAATQSIAKNCIVWVDPEWGEVTGGGKGSMYGNGGIGSGQGGLYVSW
jgi:hypothetical protein